MANKKKCFSTVKALRRRDPVLLCELLGKFPDYLRARKLRLPKGAERKNLDYQGICDACMAGDIPHKLDDVLFFVSMLGDKKGQDLVEREAEWQHLNVKFSVAGLSAADFAMKAWLHDWPKNKHLLEASYARAKIFSKSSYVYYPMISDIRGKFREPTDDLMDEARGDLNDYFVNREQLGKGTNVLKYDYPTEVWFLVRYPGQVERHASIDEEGQPGSQVFRPEEYDAVVYHKEYGDLRLNTNRAREHARYRITFGQLLFGTANVFDASAKIIHLEPLKGECLGIFKCKDIPGLTSIQPREVCFTRLELPGKEIIWKADKDTSLLEYNKESPRLLPEDTISIRYAKLRYRLENRTNWENVTVRLGKSMNYERDGDSAIIEEWLRKRK
ncbi:MAG: hypothetical protein HQ559_02210, partial [Lentisphaerae bacterium]|nr:hypothetical protein [Lentisphaerota bacterium]